MRLRVRRIILPSPWQTLADEFGGIVRPGDVREKVNDNGCRRTNPKPRDK